MQNDNKSIRVQALIEVVQEYRWLLDKSVLDFSRFQYGVQHYSQHDMA